MKRAAYARTQCAEYNGKIVHLKKKICSSIVVLSILSNTEKIKSKAKIKVFGNNYVFASWFRFPDFAHCTFTNVKNHCVMSVYSNVSK